MFKNKQAMRGVVVGRLCLNFDNLVFISVHPKHRTWASLHSTPFTTWPLQ